MFNLQLFGDNDTITSSSEGKLSVDFYDGDNRTITLDNPKTNATAAEVNALVDWMKVNHPIVGDKTGASLTGASSYKIIEKTEVKFDLT